MFTSGRGSLPFSIVASINIFWKKVCNYQKLLLKKVKIKLADSLEKLFFFTLDINLIIIQNSPENNQSIKYFICPLCQGSGQLSELMQLPPIEISYKTNNNNNSNIINNNSNNYNKNNSSNNNSNNNDNNNNNTRKSTLKSPNTIKLPLICSKLPTLQDNKMKTEKAKKNKKEYLLKPQSAHSGGDFLCNDKADFIELLPPPFTLRNPAEAMKYSMMQLNSENWEIVMQGFGTLVQVSRTEPLLLEPHMTKVNQMLCTLLRTTRSHVARYACQACKELFRTMQSTTRPEFDEIVQSLLQRTADTNKFIRHDANDALDTMVTYIPPNSSVRAIVEKGPFHKNSLIRTAVARLLLCIVTIIQVQFLFTLPAYKETRKRIFDASAVLINDANMATRNIIKRLFEMFIKDNNFDTLFQKETDKVLLKRIDKAIICLKYKPKK